MKLYTLLRYKRASNSQFSSIISTHPQIHSIFSISNTHNVNMYNLKLVSFATLMVATQVFASRINYTTEFTKGGSGGHGGSETKTSQIPDIKDREVLKDVATWSNHRFEAKRNPLVPSIIQVTSVKKVQTKEEATKVNNEAYNLVEKHIK